MTDKANARFALLLLTALNFFNYVDRNVLFAVQPLIQLEFKVDDAKMGFLTTAFFICYMVAAPPIAMLTENPRKLILGALRITRKVVPLPRSWISAVLVAARRTKPFPRKWIMAAGAMVWSLATLLTAVTHNYDELLLRHLVVGIGEATFVVISPAFLADLFPESIRGRVMGLFYLSLPVGSAVGYVMGGPVGHHFGWRVPFLVGAIPGLLLALGVLLLREPKRGAQDHLPNTAERGTILGLFRNQAYWTVSLGMAMMTFAVGGMQVWMPTFLTRVRGVPLDKANLVFGGMTVVAGTAATLFGGWLGDRLLRRTPAAYQLVSAVGMVLSIPAVVGAIYLTGSVMYVAILVGEFLILLNTAPLNAALVNSVSAPIRATAMAVNLFTIHLLGDAFSPTLIGYISDRANLQMGMVAMIVAVALSGGILVYGMRFAPHLPRERQAEAVSDGASA
jgi:MFS transporter, Spinster family, sphingosine-1-phosphate transporter